MAWGDGKNNFPGGGPWGNGGGSGGKPPGDNQPKRPQTPPPDIDELLRKSREQFRKIIPDNNGGNNRRTLGLVLGGAFALWLASGVYLVRTDEQGVVMRFGKAHHTSTPGINYHLPYPIESVSLQPVTVVNRVEIGFRSGGSRLNSKGESPIPEESLMLTGDENIVDINFEVQWIISNVEDYLFNIRNPAETVKAVAESAMREVIGKSEITTVLAPGREQVELTTKKLIQDILNNYKAGIEIVTVNLRDANPPAQALDAYRDVQSARADMETEQNKAEAYRNDIIPRARGQAEQVTQDAEAYRQEVVANAKGDAARFLAVYNEYKQAKDVTRQRIYIETMEQILQGVNKVIMDKNNPAVPYLPLQTLKPASGSTEAKQ